MSAGGGATRSAAAPERSHIPALEWAIAAFGLLLVLGTVAFLLADAARGGDGTPRIVVRADSVVALRADAYLVPFTVRNDGHGTVADVGIVGELRDGAGVETIRSRLDFVPGRSERRGGLLFSRDPRRGTVRLRVEGYQEP